jgi:hypothetical protein
MTLNEGFGGEARWSGRKRKIIIDGIFLTTNDNSSKRKSREEILRDRPSV